MIPLYRHQEAGIAELVKMSDPARGRTAEGCFWLADEMGLGKTRQVIEAAQLLFQLGEIGEVVVVSPAPVRAVWFDEEFGELDLHHSSSSLEVVQFHRRKRSWTRGPSPRLRWTVTNYDFIRRDEHLSKMVSSLKRRRALLVLDESSAVKSHKTAQTKACIKLRGACARVWLLNGTPISHSPADLYSQAYIMSPKIFGLSSFFKYRIKYAMMGGWQQKQIIGWYHPFVGGLSPQTQSDLERTAVADALAMAGMKAGDERCKVCQAPEAASIHCPAGEGLDDIKARLAPYVLRREKRDCLDLPAKLPAVTRTVTLSAESWRVYKELKDEMIAWLDGATQATAAQAGVRAMRLAQVTSGFIGGLTVEGPCGCTAPAPRSYEELDMQAYDQQHCLACGGSGVEVREVEPRVVGSEKLEFVTEFLEEKFEQGEKILVWARFRKEVERIADAARKTGVPVGLIWGAQAPAERDAALRLLDPRSAPAGPAVVVGTPATGSMGLNLTAASTVVYASNDYSLKTRLQSEDRVHRPGQVRPVSYVDVVAEGPEGQKTIDHVIVKALRSKADLASWTISAWKEALR